jgi:transcriptional regulator of arginine metabolism
MVYAVPAEETPIDPLDRLREALTLVRSFEPTGVLLVLRTAPGNAMPVARAFDVAELTEVAGCVSGDDTIFVAAREPATGADLAALCRRIQDGEQIPA